MTGQTYEAGIQKKLWRSGVLHNPGSDDAVEAGCSCQPRLNGYGVGYLMVAGFFVISEDCKYHRPMPEEQG